MKSQCSSTDSAAPETTFESSQLSRNPRVFRRFLGEQLLELLLPSTCRVCDQCVPAGDDFCVDCLNQLQSSEHVMQFACLRCGRPGAGPVPATLGANPDAQNGYLEHAQSGQNGSKQSGSKPGESNPVACPNCRGQNHAFDGCVALWTYESLVRNAVVASKYGSQVALADALGRRLGARILQAWGAKALTNAAEGADHWTVPDFITSVPSHLWRRVRRGAGGSRVLAQSVARFLRPHWSGAVHLDLMTATRQIKKQAWLGEKDRVSNVQGAFRVSRRVGGGPLTWTRVIGGSARSNRLRGKHVLLIDDVMTTGATAAENARVLKRAGARRVTVAVVARACGR